MLSTSGVLVVLSCLFTLSQTQWYKYPDQRTGYSYSEPSSSTLTNNGFYTSSQATTRPYSSLLWNSVNRDYKTTASKDLYSNPKSSTSSRKSSLAYNKHINNADAENSKFAGVENQENDDFSRTARLKRKKFHRRFGGGAHLNPCSLYGRNVGNNMKEQGRFLWDVNVYNVYPQASVGLGCGGYGGGGYVGGGYGGGGYGGLGGSFGAGLLADPVDPAYIYPGSRFANFLSLFAPGILQNSLAATVRPQQFADYGQTSTNGLQNNPEVDPNYISGQATFPVRKLNRVLYDSAGAPPITPGQLVGGISTTVNGIIQQLTGNVQPVYG